MYTAYDGDQVRLEFRPAIRCEVAPDFDALRPRFATTVSRTLPRHPVRRLRRRSDGTVPLALEHEIDSGDPSPERVAVVAAVWRHQGRSVEHYPGERGQAQPDARSTALDGTTWEAEVLTDHHDRAMPRSKFATFTEQPERQHLWIFENRQTAFETLNRLHEAPDVDCKIANAPFDTPENYSIQVGTRYIDQSHTDADYYCPGIDRIDTITGWYGRHYDDATRAPPLATPTSTSHS